MPKKTHILLIGPVTNIKENLIGGATISFGYLIDFLEARGQAFTVVNTQFFVSGIQRFFNPLLIIIQVLAHIGKTDIVFLNTSRGGTKYLLPLLVLLAKTFRKKFIFRPFGGDIKDYTANYHPFWKRILHKSLSKTDLLFLQTKALINHYKSVNYNTIQLPTSRNPALQYKSPRRAFNKRFIYIGAIQQTKGIDEILEVSQQLPPDYTLHIYGPIKEKAYHQYFKQQAGVYQGLLEKNQVLDTLNQYDVLLLPSYYEGEGYPGVIIEAYSLGIPVISTQWRSIPEIVIDGQTGRLIPIQSNQQLLAAIQSFNTNNYPAYAQKAYTLFQEKFNADKVLNKAIEAIKALT